MSSLSSIKLFVDSSTRFGAYYAMEKSEYLAPTRVVDALPKIGEQRDDRQVKTIYACRAFPEAYTIVWGLILGGLYDTTETVILRRLEDDQIDLDTPARLSERLVVCLARGRWKEARQLLDSLAELGVIGVQASDTQLWRAIPSHRVCNELVSFPPSWARLPWQCEYSGGCLYLSTARRISHK